MSTISDALRESRQIEFLVELRYGENAVKRLGLRDVTVPSTTGDPRLFRARLMSKPDLGSSYDIRSGTYGIVSVNLDIENESRIQDLELSVPVEQIEGSVYLWCNGLTWEDITTDGLLFRGRFVKVGHTLERYSCKLEDFQYTRFRTIPRAVIDAASWPSHRTGATTGACSGKAVPLVFGDHTSVPLWCVDTTYAKYVACYGIPKTVDADFDAATEIIYENDGDTISSANFAWGLMIDALGRQMTGPDFSIDEAANEVLYCSMQGYADTSGAITGTAGSLIEHPADIIYWLLKYESEFLNSEIDIGSLRSFASIIPGLKFSMYINDFVNCGDAIDRIAAQCFVGRAQLSGKVGVVTIATDAESITRLKTFSQVRRSVSIEQTPPDDLCNNLLVQYGYDPMTGNYTGTLTVDKTNNAECSFSAGIYGERPRRTWMLPDIQDAGTAQTCATRLISLKSRRHELITMEVPYWTGWDIREGDAADLTVIEGPSVDGSGWVDERCILLERQFLARSIRQTWWRVATA